MRLHSTLLAALLLSGPLSAQTRTTAATDHSADRAAVLQRIEAILRAGLDRDSAALLADLAPDWRGFHEDSRALSHGPGGYLADPDSGASAALRLIRLRDLDIRFYGDVAVAAYVANLEVVGDSEAQPRALCVVDVFTKRGTAWVQVASHRSRDAETEADRAGAPRPVTRALADSLLAARDAVWRAFFEPDPRVLARALPPELIAIQENRADWERRGQLLREAAEYVRQGGQLIRLEFPHTEMQVFGSTAILYYTYAFGTGLGGHAAGVDVGRGTEVFVRRGGHWVDVGWHLDNGPSSRPTTAEGSPPS